eukprot:Hpha_TRINITY_DN16550_c0_g3::TRINITY_DN16550_c0_g3_i1::g.132623::m.132623/K00106/XDH; xanthine dehydrogenase/oxidase
MSKPTDSRLARLLAPSVVATSAPQPVPKATPPPTKAAAKTAAPPASPPPAPAGAKMVLKVAAKQADGHGAVRFRTSVDAKTLCLIPDGSEMLLVRVEGDWAKVSWQGMQGYVKARNLRRVGLVPAPAPEPATCTEEKAPLGSTVCSFQVNGTAYTIDLAKDNRVNGITTVHDYLVTLPDGKGLRRNCGVGRCGVCVAMLSYTDPATGQAVHRAFNTCLRPILSCNGMAITTTHGLGTTAQPHPVQKALADHSGTQCGFCSAGQVMSIYAHLAGSEAKGNAVSGDGLEKALDGNLCRCTGYRPIIAAARSFAKSAPSAVDAPVLAADETSVQSVTPDHVGASVPLVNVKLPSTGPSPVSGSGWVEVRTEQELQAALVAAQGSDIMLVGGNTSRGLHPTRRPDALINIAGVASLRALSASATSLTIGAMVTMTDAQEFLAAQAKAVPALDAMAKHALLSPGTPIRNTGTVGGNVALMHEHQKDGEFCTEWPLLFQGWGATVTVVDSAGAASTLSFEDFWGTDMTKKYIRQFDLPLAEAAGRTYRTFRTSVRHYYAQQFSGAAMCAKVDASGVVQKGSVRIVMNNVTARPLRATALEQALEGATVSDQSFFEKTLLPALESVIANPDPTLYGDVEYRRQLHRSYFYKFMLSLQPSLSPGLATAALPWLERPGQVGTQTFHTDPSVYPLNAPLVKIDGLKQCTAEATYVQDISLPTGCLHGCPVLAEEVGEIDTIDDTAAKAMPGFQVLLTHKDVPLLCPGMLSGEPGAGSRGELFTPLFAKTTDYVGHIVALALADTQQAAVECARAVKVTYKSTKSPLILTVDDAIAAKSFIKENNTSMTQGDADAALKTAEHVLSDTFLVNEQMHYHMESQSCLADPQEDLLVLHTSTQVPKMLADAVRATLLEVISHVDVRQRRVGGGFGGKLQSSIIPASLSAFAAHHLKKPVRVIFELTDNMKAVGRRPQCQVNYQVGYNSDGTIVAVKGNAYFANSGGDAMNFVKSCDNSYSIPNWNIQSNLVSLDTPVTRSCRGPGWVPGIYFAERMLCRVADALGTDRAALKQKHFYQKGGVTPYGMPLTNWNMPELWSTLRKSSNYDARVADIQKWNAGNRWVKRGIAFTPSKFTFEYDILAHGLATGIMMDCRVQVNADGSVSVLSGGTEMGQGLTTKVAQTISYYLGCDMKYITFQEQQTRNMGSILTAEDATGGSVGSEITCLAAKNCCIELNKGLAPVKKELGPDATWEQIAAKAASIGVELNIRRTSTDAASPVDKEGDVYNTLGAVVTEVSVDVLTGQVNMGRCDLIFDIGRSVNPYIDVGQMEGGFMMGVGLCLLEEVDYNAKGDLKYVAATYEAPGTIDVPQEWHVSVFNAGPFQATPNGAKAIAEPPVSLAYSAVDAVEQALASAAKDAGAAPPRAVNLPFTVDKRQTAAGVKTSLFKLH